MFSWEFTEGFFFRHDIRLRCDSSMKGFQRLVDCLHKMSHDFWNFQSLFGFTIILEILIWGIGAVYKRHHVIFFSFTLFVGFLKTFLVEILFRDFRVVHKKCHKAFEDF